MCSFFPLMGVSGPRRRCNGPVKRRRVFSLWFGAWLVLLWHSPAVGAGAYTPILWPECQPISWHWLESATTRTESASIAVITRDGRSKGLVDFVRVSDSETALGWSHETWERGNYYPYTGDRWDVLPLLYSEIGQRRLLGVWRARMARVRRAARQAGCDGDCLVAALALANSGPTPVVRWLQQGNATRNSLCKSYIEARPTGHRQRRCAALEPGDSPDLEATRRGLEE